jgi:uncharacterized protein (DUF2236 family)
VHREAVVLVGGGRALLLQVAHPLVAAGVAAHSRFRAHPLERLWRTLDLMLRIVFADGAAALGAVREIERVHARVQGTLEEDVGPFARGTPYRAGDPALLLWVYATLLDTALDAYERFVGPLGAEAKAVYYEESKVGARLLGIPDGLLPPAFADFQGYFHSQLAGDVLAVGRAGREIAAAILRPSLPVGLAPAVSLARFVTVGLLPPVLRERYGLSWSGRCEAALGALAAAVRSALPWLPAPARFLPHARRAGAGPAGFVPG